MPSVRLDLDGPVARITLNRPEVLNAGDPAWVAELTDVVARVGALRELRVAVIAGAGRAFSTGVDLGSLAAGEMTLPHFVAWEDAMTAIERMPVPFIAAINGHCLGGGLQLALVCDYRLAAADAVIGLPAVKECLIPSMALYRLPRLIGAARAREMILTGEPISATEAERAGLVARVVPDELVVEDALALAATIAAQSPLALRLAKEAVNAAYEMSLSDALTHERRLFYLLFASDDQKEGMAAFLEKRTPDFTGR